MLLCSINHRSEILSFASVKIFIYHMLEFVKTCLCCKENYSSIIFVKILKRNVVTLHQLLNSTQQNEYTKPAEYSIHYEESTVNLDIIWSLNFSHILNIKMIMQYSLYKKLKFFIEGFFSKWKQIRRKLQICSHLAKITLAENFIFGAKFLVFTLHSRLCWLDTIRFLCTLHYNHIVPIKLFNKIYLPEDIPK